MLLFVRDGRPILQSRQPFAQNRTEWPCRAALQHRLAALLSPGSTGARAATLTYDGTFSFSDQYMEWHLQVLIGVSVGMKGRLQLSLTGLRPLLPRAADESFCDSSCTLKVDKGLTSFFFLVFSSFPVVLTQAVNRTLACGMQRMINIVVIRPADKVLPFLIIHYSTRTTRTSTYLSFTEQLYAFT